MGRGLVRVTLRDIKKGLNDYENALKFKPEDSELLNNIGLALVEDLRPDDAILAYQRALNKTPYAAHIHSNLGIAYAMQRKHGIAIKCYERAMELDPDAVGPSWNRSLALLATGDYERGWLSYEIRKHRKPGPRVFEKPCWLGDFDISTMPILIHAEQGLGDTLQFCRYVNLVAKKCPLVHLMVPKSLTEICSTLESRPNLISDTEDLPDFDAHCPLMSLPLALKTEISSIPNRVPYLFADPLRAAMWGERLERSSGLKVGIVWSGGFHAERPGVWGVNARRDIPFECLDVLDVEGVEWISLQKGIGVKELESERYLNDWRGPRFQNIGEEFEDFADTAALIANLDLVISVDTSVAHLAGALGKPIWILNRFDSCWRWFVNRSESPWYPTAVLYNQPKLGDWDSVLRNVRNDLELIVSNKLTALVVKSKLPHEH